MHNCQQNSELMMDLLFAPDPSVASDALERCPRCLAELESMRETLQVFDQSVALAQPAPVFWGQYESALRTKLAAMQHSESSHPQRGVWPTIGFAWGWAALLMIVGLGTGIWWSTTDKENQQAQRVLVPRASATQATDYLPINNNVDPIPPRRKRESHRGDKAPRKEGERAPTRKPFAIFDPHPLAIEIDVPMAFEQNEIALKLEKAQLILRGFRHLKPGDDGISFEVAEEKSRARAILQTITQIRRSAESTGNLPLEDTVAALEPVLRDIANLPDRAGVDEVSAIKALMQRNEIVGVLQNYLESFSASQAVAD